MDSLDKLLQKHSEQAAKAVEPVYDEVRASIHSRMRVRSALRIGTLLMATSAILILGWWTIVSPTTQPTVIAGNGDFGDAVPTDNVAAPAPPELILNASKNSAHTEPGHTLPVQIYVNKNEEAVSAMIEGNVSIAQSAEEKGDFKQAASAYMNLARTLDLYDKNEQMQWATDKAAEMAAKTSDARFIEEIAIMIKGLKQ